MEYVKKGQTVECTDCGTEMLWGARYEMKGEPDQPVCIACCYDQGMTISDPDEACPECGGASFEIENTDAFCEECGHAIDLTHDHPEGAGI